MNSVTRTKSDRGPRKTLVSRLSGMLPRNGFTRGVAIIAGGSVISKGLMIAVSPILTRIYSPTDFGLLAVYSAFLTITTVWATLQYQRAIPLPEDNEEAANLFAVTAVMTILVSVSSIIVIGFWGGAISSLLKVPQVRPYLWLLPASILLLGTYQALQYWAIRRKSYPIIARTNVSQATGAVTSQVGMGLLIGGPIGLITGQIVGQSAGISSLAKEAWKTDRGLVSSLSFTRMTKAALRYKQFPIYTTWSEVFNAVSLQGPALLLTFFFGPIVTGLYALSYKVMQAPLALLGKSISDVFLSGAAEARRDGVLTSQAHTLFNRLLEVGLPLLAIVGLSAEPTFGIVFGEEWRIAGRYAQWLTPWLLFSFLTAPLASLALVYEKQHIEFIFQGLLVTIRIAAIVIGGAYLNNIDSTLILFSLGSAVCLCGKTFWLLSISGNQPSDTLRGFARAILYSLPVILLVLATVLLTDRDYVIVIAAGVAILLQLALTRVLHLNRVGAR